MAKEMTDSTPTLKSYNSIEEILRDKNLAGLGDSYVNFVYSLAISKKLGRPTGAKVNNRILATAVDASGLRKFLPRRVDRHNRGNAAEALLVLAWLQDLLEMEDCIKVLTENDDVVKAFAILLQQIMHKLGVSHEHK